MTVERQGDNWAIGVTTTLHIAGKANRIGSSVQMTLDPAGKLKLVGPVQFDGYGQPQTAPATQTAPASQTAPATQPAIDSAQPLKGQKG